MFRCYVLPLSTTETELPKSILATLLTGQRATGVQFPKTAEIVLCHDVNYPQRWLVTSHAGWLLKTKSGYVYIEKSGGKGPFVRLDLETKSAPTATESGAAAPHSKTWRNFKSPFRASRKRHGVRR